MFIVFCITELSPRGHNCMYTSSSHSSYLDTIRDRRLTLCSVSSDILGIILSYLPYAALPPLRRINSLWYAIIDVTIAAAIGPVVLDAAGNSSTITEFWIRAGRGDEWVARRSAQSHRYLAVLPRLLGRVLDQDRFEPDQPADKLTIDIALLQLIRDRPLVALSYSCERMWRAFDAIRDIQVRNTIMFAAVWGSASSIRSVRRKIIAYIDTGVLSPVLAMELTHHDVRMVMLIEFVLGRIISVRHMINTGLVKLTPTITEMMISIAMVAALDGHNVLAQLRFLANLWQSHPRACAFARSVLQRLDGLAPEVFSAASKALGPPL